MTLWIRVPHGKALPVVRNTLKNLVTVGIVVLLYLLRHMAFHAHKHKISERTYSNLLVCPRNMSSIGHTFLQQQLTEDMQKTFASSLKNTVSRRQKTFAIAKLFALLANATRRNKSYAELPS